MARIVIIGNSAAGFSCLKALLGYSLDIELSVISQEENNAYRKDLMLSYLAGNIKEEELYLCGDDFYVKNNVSFSKCAKTVKVDLKKKQVILKDNTKVSYDYLVIASGLKPVPLKSGMDRKQDVISVYGLEDIKKIKERLILPGVITVTGEPSLAGRVSQIIASYGREVKLICAQKPQGFIESDKIELFTELSLSEIITESLELKAVKLSNGKAIGTSMVLFVGEYIPSIDFLKDSNINTSQDHIVINDNMQTNIENIFACGSVAIKKDSGTSAKSWQQACEDGVNAAGIIKKLLEGSQISCQQMS